MTKRFKDFKVIFNGGIESSNSIKSFKWLTDIDTSALEPVSVTETIKSLKSTVGDDLDNTVKSVVDTVKANKEALKSTADELKNLFGRKTIELAEAINSKSTKNLLEDCGSFESGNLDAWQHYIMDYDGVELNVSEETAKSGKRSVKFLMAENSGISKIFKISQNAKCVLSGWQKGYITLGTSCYASLVFYSKSGKAILRKTFIFPTSEGKHFSKFICAEKAPKGATYVSVSVFASRMKKPDYLFVDDLSFTVSN